MKEPTRPPAREAHGEPWGRVDLHLHSRASNVTDYYATKTLAIPECYSDPVEIYRLLKARGMHLVTLTDHNSIDGALELQAAGLPDVFLSAEMTARFPEDGCHVHVVVVNVTEGQFAEVNRLRRNIYEMVDYLDAQTAKEAANPAGNRLAYFLAHPLMSTQNRPYGREGSLTRLHIEKALLLFDCFEVQNGARAKSLNGVTRALLASLTPQTIDRLANTHRLAPKGEAPWVKAIVGGSDDHSGINPGRTWTEFPCSGASPAANDLVQAMRHRRTRPAGAHGGPLTLAHAIVKLLYDGQVKAAAARQAPPVNMGDAINLLLRFALRAEPATIQRALLPRARLWFRAAVVNPVCDMLGMDQPFERLLIREEHRLLTDSSFRQAIARTERADDRIFLIVSTLLNRICSAYLATLRAAGSRNLVDAIKAAVSLVSSNVFVSLPYFLCYSHMSADRFLIGDVRKAFALDEPERLVLVTDTFFEVNGVAHTIRRVLREAQRRGVDLTVVTAASRLEERRAAEDPEIRALVEAGRLKMFTSVANLDLPEYEGLQLRILPFLELLQYAQEQGFTKMQISTPGPVGLMGLLAAKILQIETASTYHTSLPEYVETYTGDVSLEALTWKALVLFYHAVDEVIVPSKLVGKLLHQRGLRSRKLLVLDRWVDPVQFHPGKRTPGYWKRFGLEHEDDLVKFVYVGRVAAEKNLDVLAAAYRALRQRDGRGHLIIVGDGPYRPVLAERLRGVPVTFTGFLQGDDLARAIASADAKLFPSTTDTWGNAPLEAQASGLPVVVSDSGGPQELMEHGVTGFRVAGGDERSLLAAMVELMNDATRRRMGLNARRYIEAGRVERPYSAILESRRYRERARSAKLAKRVARAVETPDAALA